MRNLQKTVEQGRDILHARPQLDLSYSELSELMEQVKAKAQPGDELFTAISLAYKMGIAVGIRNGKRKS